MKIPFAILVFGIANALVLAACSKIEPADTVASLLANPKRHSELRSECKADHDKVGDALCNLVAEATRQRFMGEGKSPYVNAPVPNTSPPATAKD